MSGTAETGHAASKSRMKWTAIAILGLFMLTGCRPAPKTPDEIRRDTASATGRAVRNTKAVAQGIVDGLKSGGLTNINTASREKLKKLPGIDAAAAGRIIAGRPYKDSADLRRRHILSRAAYDRIATKIETH